MSSKPMLRNTTDLTVFHFMLALGFYGILTGIAYLLGFINILISVTIGIILVLLLIIVVQFATNTSRMNQN